MTQTPTQPAAAVNEPLLTGELMHKLDRLDVLSRKILAGKMHGERRSKKKGQSVEFADYRPYVAGDDLRRIDWNLYARLDRLFLRLFMEEEDLSVYVLVDTTRSMDYGDPHKLLYAKRVAAALAYIALAHHNRVYVAAFADTLTDQLPALRGRRPIPRVLDFLQRQAPLPGGNLAAALKRFALSHTQKGVVVIVSDFLDKGDPADALRYLAGNRYDAYALQVLAPQELDPVAGQLVGDLKLEDCEDGDMTEVSATPALIKRYQANLQAYCTNLRRHCLRRGITYMTTDTSVPFDTVVLQYLRHRGLVG